MGGMSLRSISFRSVVGAIILASLGGCEGGNVKSITVGGRTFHVPKAHLENYYAPWTIDGKPAGLRFIVNPDARLQEQMTVGVDPSQGTCQPSTRPKSNMLEWACKLGQDAPVQTAVAFNPEKIFDRPGDKTQWAYKVPDGLGGHREIAGCYALGNGNVGQCRSITSYKDLIYSVGFRDDDITRLPEILAKVNGLLSSWEEPSH